MADSKSLLIIEDDPDLRMTLEYFLGKIGYEVLTAKTCEEGLKLCMKHLPRAVLCDIMLPGGMNGYEACEKIKGDPATRDTKIIFISARPESEMQLSGAKTSADFYIPKPVDPNDVGADLYFLFEEDFQPSSEDMKRLRVTRKIPSYHDAVTPGYGPQEKTAPHLTPPPTGYDLKYGDEEKPKKKQTAEPPPQPETPAEPEVVPHQESPNRSPSSMELRQVHDLLMALKTSLKDTSLRLEAILQYIEVIDEPK